MAVRMRKVLALSTELHRQLTVLATGCSILCSIHSADETQPGRNSCPEFAIFVFQFGLYHVVVTLSFSFLRSVSLADIVLVIESTLETRLVKSYNTASCDIKGAVSRGFGIISNPQKCSWIDRNSKITV